MKGKDIVHLIEGLRNNPEVTSNHQNNINIPQMYSKISSCFEIVKNKNSDSDMFNSIINEKLIQDDLNKTLTEEYFNFGEENNLTNFNNFNNECKGSNKRINLGNDKQENLHEIKYNTGRWSSDEHQKFIEAMFLYGNEWRRVQQHIRSRSSTQARSHAQKFFIRLRKKFLENDENDDLSSSMRRNEKIFKWIKESVNYDTILKLSNISENLLTSSEKKCLKNKKKNSSDTNGAFGCNTMSLQNIEISDQDLFFTERKQKMCKIILNLIKNPSKTKRKNFNKEIFEDSYNDNDDDDYCPKEMTENKNIENTSNNFNHNINSNICQNHLFSNCKLNIYQNSQYSEFSERSKVISINKDEKNVEIEFDDNKQNNLIKERINNVVNPNSNGNNYFSFLTINFGGDCMKTPNMNMQKSNEYVNIVNIPKENVHKIENEKLIKEMIPNKILTMEYQKVINQSNDNILIGSTNNKIVTNSNNLNIINGIININDDKEKEFNIDNNPFRLNFDDNIQICTKKEDDIMNFNLDLDHFFKTDNFLN